MKKWAVIGVIAVVLLGAAGVGGSLLLFRGFGPGGESAAPGAAPVFPGEPVEVRHGEINSRVVLSATVRAEPGVPVRSRAGGTVTRVWLGDGQSVEEGAPVVSIAVPDESAAVGDGDASRTVESVVRAPATGTLSGLGDLAVGDPVEPGPVAQIVKDEFHAVAAITPNEVYRFYEDPSEILLKIDKGPFPEPCEFVSLGAPSDGDAAGGSAEGADLSSGGDASIELVCRVPPSLRVFPGVRGKLSIVTGRAKNALIVPVTAVRGSVERGEVIVVNADGSQEVRAVELGLSDGTSVEVVKGLSIGDSVMDPVPLAEEFDVPSESDPFAEDGAFDGHGVEE